MGECAGVEEQLKDKEEDETLPLRTLSRPKNWEVEACVNEDASDNLERKLDKDIGDEERLPGIGLAGAFSNLVELSLGDE